MRKIVIFCDTFYPDPMVASVRMTQWCRHLPEHGWQPIVVTRHRGYHATAEQLAKHVHPSLIVEYLNAAPKANDAVRVQESRKRPSLRALLARASAAVLVPDASIVFWMSMRKRVLEAVERHKPDVVLTTSPPHGIHTIGEFVSQETGIPWVADFRDPHSIDRRFQPKGWLAPLQIFHRRFDRNVYRRADLVVNAIPLHSRFARLNFEEAAGKTLVIENGVPAELQAAHGGISGALGQDERQDGGTQSIRSERKSIRVIGSIDPHELLGVGEAILMLLQLRVDCELRVVGGIIPGIDALSRELGDRLVTTGYLRHEEALREVLGADLLLCYNGEDRSKNLQLTSKLFEFLATTTPVVVINPTKPDRHLLRGVAGVRVLKNPSTSEVAHQIREALTEGRRSQEDARAFREKYSRGRQVGCLVEQLNRLVSAGIKSCPMLGAFTLLVG